MERLPPPFIPSIIPEPEAAPNPRPPVAVALEQPRGQPDLPKITAAGRGLLAEEIVRLALAHGVKVREDADLAELLATLDLETTIPSEAIVAVGEILAKVYEANQAMESAR